MTSEDPFSYQLNFLKLIGFNLKQKYRIWDFYALLIYLCVLIGLIGLVLYGYENFAPKLLAELAVSIVGWWTVLVRFAVLFANRNELNDLIVELREMTKIGESREPIKSPLNFLNNSSKST
jgi:hypothetical protein